MLDDTSVSYCHYKNPCTKRRLIPLDILHKGIVFAMKENVNIQFLYPDYDLPDDYQKEIETVDHIKILLHAIDSKEQVVVLNDWWKMSVNDAPSKKNVIIQTNLELLLDNTEKVREILFRVSKLNIMLTGITGFKERDLWGYQAFLEEMSDHIVDLYKKGYKPQLNILTDRLFLSEMNNCGAGDFCITLAPNGCFYICPAFYYNNPDNTIGSVETSLGIKNPQLYKLSHAPICRICDAYQCKRCIWDNCNTTMDCNTPSHEQCVVAHLERNASRKLIDKLGKAGVKLNDCQEIKEIDYFDPFIIANRWK